MSSCSAVQLARWLRLVGDATDLSEVCSCLAASATSLDADLAIEILHRPAVANGANRPDHIRSDPSRSDQARSDQIRSNQIRPGQIRAEQSRAGQVRSEQTRADPRTATANASERSVDPLRFPPFSGGCLAGWTRRLKSCLPRAVPIALVSLIPAQWARLNTAAGSALSRTQRPTESGRSGSGGAC